MWEKPTEIAKWKEEHVSFCMKEWHSRPVRSAQETTPWVWFPAQPPIHSDLCSFTSSVGNLLQIVFLVLGGWGVGIYSAMKIFGGGKKEAPAA
jgi:hypothetical protein